MQRINTANAAMNLFGVGKHGFQGGNPSTNTPATFFSPEWANAIQEELARAIEGLGVAINPGSSSQLLDALVAYFTPKSQFSGEIGKISFVPATSASPNHLPAFGVEVSRATYPLVRWWLKLRSQRAPAAFHMAQVAWAGPRSASPKPQAWSSRRFTMVMAHTRPIPAP
jgi:hypothetical protein